MFHTVISISNAQWLESVSNDCVSNDCVSKPESSFTILQFYIIWNRSIYIYKIFTFPSKHFKNHIYIYIWTKVYILMSAIDLLKTWFSGRKYHIEKSFGNRTFITFRCNGFSTAGASITWKNTGTYSADMSHHISVEMLPVDLWFHFPYSYLVWYKYGDTISFLLWTQSNCKILR